MNLMALPVPALAGPDCYSDVSSDSDSEGTLTSVDRRNLCDPRHAARSSRYIFAAAVGDCPAGITSRRFAARQPEVTPRLREAALRWLTTVHRRLGVTYDTLHGAARCLDIALCRTPIRAARLHLWALTCLWVAAKVDEIAPPDGEELLDAAQRGFARCELLQCERDAMRTLGYRAGYPTAALFLARLEDATEASPEVA